MSNPRRILGTDLLQSPHANQDRLTPKVAIPSLLGDAPGCDYEAASLGTFWGCLPQPPSDSSH